MAHQIIHTSCKRGISNQSDGFQVYSFDEGFKPEVPLNSQGNVYLIPDFLKYGNYEAPSTINLDENTIHLAPKEFAYEVQEGRVIFLNRIPCKDYAKEWARWGNVFKHFIICSPNEVLSYPSEYYHSRMLKEGLSSDEASIQGPPAYLDVPTITPGNTISEDEIINFLAIGDNKTILVNMVYALLHSNNGEKKIVICDDSENIIRWIAAIEYILPVSLAKKISFTTYTNNPEFSCYWICGVVPEGTNYNPQNATTLTRMFVFDIKQKIFSEITSTDSAFYDFIANFSSYDDVLDFHQYLTQYTDVEINPDFAALYSLYEFEKFGFTMVDNLNLNIVLDYLERKLYGTPKYHAIVNNFLSSLQEIDNLENTRYITIMDFIKKALPTLSAEHLNMIKSVIIKRISSNFCDISITSDEFENISSSSQEISKTEIYAGLIKKEELEHISSVLNADVPYWKLKYLHSIYLFAVQNNAPGQSPILDKQQLIGAFYSKLFETCERQYPQQYGDFVSSIIKDYETDKHNLLPFICLVYDVCNRELLKKQGVDIWDKFNTIVSNSWDEVAINSVYKKLQELNLQEQSFSLYLKQISNAHSCASLGKILLAHNNLLSENPKYEKNFISRSYDEVWTVIDKLDAGDKDKCKNILLTFCSKRNVVVSPDKLKYLTSLFATISPGDQAIKNREVLQRIESQYVANKTKVPEDLSLLLFGIRMFECTTVDAVISTMTPVRIPVSYSKKSTEEYIGWIVPNIRKLVVSEADLIIVSKYIVLTEDESTIYIKTLVKEFCDHKDEPKFLEFITYIAKLNDSSKQELYEKYLLKELSKKDLASIDAQLIGKYGANTKVNRYWKALRENSENHGLKNLFKFHKNEEKRKQ